MQQETGRAAAADRQALIQLCLVANARKPLLSERGCLEKAAAPLTQLWGLDGLQLLTCNRNRFHTQLPSLLLLQSFSQGKVLDQEVKHSHPGPATPLGPSLPLLRIRAGEQLRLGDPHHSVQHVPASAAEPGNNLPGSPAALKIAPLRKQAPQGWAVLPGTPLRKVVPRAGREMDARRKAARSSGSASKKTTDGGKDR